jgi:hypothetical protein
VSCCPTTTCYPPPAKPCCGETPSGSGTYDRGGPVQATSYRQASSRMVPVRANYGSDIQNAPRAENAATSPLHFFQQNGLSYATDRATGAIYTLHEPTGSWRLTGAPIVAARR